MSRAELLYAVAAAGANVLGALTVVAWGRWSAHALDALLSLAAGFLVALAVLDLIPDSVARQGAAASFIMLTAYLVVHLVQHAVGAHAHPTEAHEISEVVGLSAFVGLLMHTFVDGVAVASAVRVSPTLGALVFVAVVLHKFPEGLAIASLFLAAGLGPRRAMLAALALGVTTIAGVLTTHGVPWLGAYGLPVAAGVTLYVGASNLVPELRTKSGWRVPASFGVGCALYWGARVAAGA